MVSTLLLAAALGVVAPAPLPGEALTAAFGTCEAWISDPASWADHIPQFPKRSKLDAAGLKPASTIPSFAAPPPGWRRALHFWSVPVDAGNVWISTSDILPICHFASNASGMASAIEEMLGSAEFTKSWKRENEMTQGAIRTSRFRKDGIVLTVSRLSPEHAKDAGPQIVVSEQLELGN